MGKSMRDISLANGEEFTLGTLPLFSNDKLDVDSSGRSMLATVLHPSTSH